MKCYKTFVPSPLPVGSDSDSEEVVISAKMLGSSIADGRYNGVSDGSAGLLHGQYDNDHSLGVDPLCDLSTDVFGMRSGPSVEASQPSGQPTD